MGHAYLRNISDFFVNRLFALGKLSIAECVAALQRKGETLHAAEGEYDDEGALGLGVEDVVSHLLGTHLTGPPDGDTPWIEPLFDVWFGSRAQAKLLSAQSRELLKNCEANPGDELAHSVAADRLIENGLDDWARHVRTLPQQRRVFQEWVDGRRVCNWDGEWAVMDSIHWKFRKGWRARYREVPRLDNVSH